MRLERCPSLWRGALRAQRESRAGQGGPVPTKLLRGSVVVGNPTDRQVVVVAAAAVAANLFQPLDVERVEAAEVALHGVLVHLLTQLGQLLLAQVLGPERGGAGGRLD